MGGWVGVWQGGFRSKDTESLGLGRRVDLFRMWVGDCQVWK